MTVRRDIGEEEGHWSSLASERPPRMVFVVTTPTTYRRPNKGLAAAQSSGLNIRSFGRIFFSFPKLGVSAETYRSLHSEDCRYFL
jgi:hypothetical protein